MKALIFEHSIKECKSIEAAVLFGILIEWHNLDVNYGEGTRGDWFMIPEERLLDFLQLSLSKLLKSCKILESCDLIDFMRSNKSGETYFKIKNI